MRQICVFGDYFKDFRKSLGRDALKKVYQVLTLIMTLEIVPTRFLKSIEDRNGLYEVRVDYEGCAYRIFCCFDGSNQLVLLNGFQKKTQKTPNKQIERAESLMKQYLSQKKR